MIKNKNLAIIISITTSGFLIIIWTMYLLLNPEMWIEESGTGEGWRILFALGIGFVLAIVGIWGFVNAYRLRNLSF